MDTVATNSESLTRVPAPAGGMTAFERIQARLDAMADASQPSIARGRDYLDPNDIPFGDAQSESWVPNDVFWADRARHWEEIAPTIDHKPVVSLFDPYGNERIITKPLPVGERFDPATIADPRKRAGFEKWIKGNHEAKQARAMSSMMEFACRVIDGVLDEEKPKKARAPKIESNPAKATAQAEAIANAKSKRERPQRERRRVKDRRERFVQNGKVIRADRTYLPFDEEFEITGLRTELGLFGPAIFSSRIAKGAAHGTDKRKVYDGKDLAPIDLRDMEYLVENWDKVRGNLVVDLDGRLDGRRWKTRADLRRDLVEILGVKLVPTMVAYRLDAAGDIEGGHAFWVLPPGSEVGVCGESRGGPVRFHSMVQDALINALMPLGADPGHTNTAKTKCPLAPRWSLMCFENFPDLSEIAAGLPTLAVDRKEMRREHARLKRKAAGDEAAPVKQQSMLKFNDMNDCWKAAIREGFRTHDQAFLAALKAESSTAYGKWLKSAGIPRIREVLGLPPGTELSDDERKILAKQITWRCANRPSIKTRYYDGDNRGRDKEAQAEAGLTGAELPAARKAQGDKRKELAGIVTRANQAEDSRDVIQEQLELYRRIGGDLDDAEAVARFIIRSGKRKKSCVYKWLEVLLPSFRDASRYNARPDNRNNRSASIQSEQSIPVTVPSDPVVSIVATVDQASVLVSGKPGHDHHDLCGPPAKPASSAQACRLHRPAVRPVARTFDDRPSSPAEHAATWLLFGDRRIVITSASMAHGDHDTIQ